MSIPLSTYQGIHVRKLTEASEKTTKKLQVTVENTYTALGIIPVPISDTGKPHDSQNIK